MFDTPVLNVAIGLVFCFAATALAASTLTEALASLIKLRANTLVSGVQKMFNDPQFSGLALAIYNHALVSPQTNGKIQSRSRFWSYSGPSYIRACDFATATVDVLQQVPGDMAKLKANVDAIPDAQLKQLLQGMVIRAEGSFDNVEARAEHLRSQLADWFNASMDRVSGAYKRQAQLISFLFGLVLAVSINVDATHVTTVLWANPTMARQLADNARAFAPSAGAAPAAASAPVADAVSAPDRQAVFAQLWQLPVGPDLLAACAATESDCTFGRRVTGYNLLGWLITAVASVFGAPFWFDMLGKLVQLRGSGPKPGQPAKS